MLKFKFISQINVWEMSCRGGRKEEGGGRPAMKNGVSTWSRWEGGGEKKEREQTFKKNLVLRRLRGHAKGRKEEERRKEEGGKS